mgnify:CR=1 FL=1
MSLDLYLGKLRRLNVNVAGGRASPHKICMLLAVLDLARGGALTENRIEYAPPLLERYAMYFNAVRGPGDHPNPYFPFFHLAGSLRGGGASFWHLQPRPGRESVFESMSTARTARQMTENIDHARLDTELFEALSGLDADEQVARAQTEAAAVRQQVADAHLAGDVGIAHAEPRQVVDDAVVPSEMFESNALHP